MPSDFNSPISYHDYGVCIESFAGSIDRVFADFVILKFLLPNRHITQMSAMVICTFQIFVNIHWDRPDRKGSSFITQATSWSPLKISISMFCMLCHHFKVFPVFINVLSGFGFKISDVNELSPACFRHFDHLEEIDKPSSCGEWNILIEITL